MKLPVARVAVGVVFVTAVLLSACDNKDVAAPASTRSEPANAGTQVPDPSVDVTDEVSGPGGGAVVSCDHPEMDISFRTVEPIRYEGVPYKDSSDGDVDCGPVGPAGGEQSKLMAISTEAGTVGCEEAFTVMGEYYRDAPRRSSGQGPLDVRGWNCMNGYGVNPACTKDGLLFYAEEQY